MVHKIAIIVSTGNVVLLEEQRQQSTASMIKIKYPQ